ncbi:hypothetical protein ACHAXS_003507 [Conticribra weissflogii]
MNLSSIAIKSEYRPSGASVNIAKYPSKLPLTRADRWHRSTRLLFAASSPIDKLIMTVLRWNDFTTSAKSPASGLCSCLMILGLL